MHNGKYIKSYIGKKYSKISKSTMVWLYNGNRLETSVSLIKVKEKRTWQSRSSIRSWANERVFYE
jgi:hypothetical protein